MTQCEYHHMMGCCAIRPWLPQWRSRPVLELVTNST